MIECKASHHISLAVLQFMVCLSVYLYLNVNALNGIHRSIDLVVEEDLQAIRKNKFGVDFLHPKVKEQFEKGIEEGVLAQRSKTSTVSAATHKPSTNSKSEVDKCTHKKLTLLEKFKCDIIANNSEPLLTLFTTWKDSPEKYLVHNLTLNNWVMLRPFIIAVIFTNETLVAKECARKGFETLYISTAAAGGIPVLKYMYRDVIKNYKSTFYAYSNGDILYTDTLIYTLLLMKYSKINLHKPVLIVGQRSNVYNVNEFEGSTWGNITRLAKERGKLFTFWAEDYFITTCSFPWQDIAEVVIGRRAYDNWLVYYARKSKFTVIDATKTILAVHQTTKAGNKEGLGRKNKDFNHNLLVKLYKRVKYNAGITACIANYTHYDNGVIVVKSRTINKSCTI